MTVIASVFAVVLLVTSSRYGYHRDEMYFLAAGRRLDWGYPDQPPLTPALARLMAAVDPDSLWVLRLPALAAATLVVVCAGLMAGELGGGRGARALAAGAVASAAVVQGAGHLFGTTIFDLAAWSLICLLVLKLLRPAPDPRWWLLIGIVVGIGLLNKALLIVPVAALALGLLLIGRRKLFANRYFPLAVGLAALLVLPYLWWQAGHGWPQWELSRAIAGGSSGTSDSPIMFVLLQFGLFGPLLVPLWIYGAWRLWHSAYRAFVLTYGALFVLFLLAGGKAYYLGGMYPVLLAAGSVGLASILGDKRKLWAAVGSVIALNAAMSAVLFLPILPVSDLPDSPVLAVNYDAGETIGWPEVVAQVAAARPPGAEILTANYGEAGAIERYGPDYGLPTPFSGHNAYWWWGPPPDSATTVLTVGIDQNRLAEFCAAVEPVGVLDNGLDLDNDEQGAPLTLCRPRAPWSTLWPTLRALG
ncbi:glycosyltransferase family 39 protein [Nocardia neocaledoniensis]|uniref:glycosyltransferase family 39 protein n=1 Tax=Nocardia neocaledoniensis TaxID=236511 RepID=UPI000D711E63|nr:glycosyltransferase family 39 protein [Nocardia neocaledoniensis]